MGDLLFTLVNLARKLGIEPESALRMANEKFSEAVYRAGGCVRGTGTLGARCDARGYGRGVATGEDE